MSSHTYKRSISFLNPNDNNNNNNNNNNNKGKEGNEIPLQAWTSPEGSRNLRLPYLKTIGTLMW